MQILAHNGRLTILVGLEKFYVLGLGLKKKVLPWPWKIFMFLALASET